MHTYNHAVEIIWQFSWHFEGESSFADEEKKKEPEIVSHGRECTDVKRKHEVTQGTGEWLQAQPGSSPFPVNPTLLQRGLSRAVQCLPWACKFSSKLNHIISGKTGQGGVGGRIHWQNIPNYSRKLTNKTHYKNEFPLYFSQYWSF